MCVVCVAFLLTASPVEAKKKDKRAKSAKAAAERTWYAQAYAEGDRGTLITHFWSKGPMFRAESVIAGRRIVTIVNGEYYYTIDAVSGTGVAVRRTPSAVAEDAARERPFGNEHLDVLAQGGEKVGVEKLGGKTCDVYRLTDGKGRRSVCVSTELGLPIRITTFRRATARTDETSYVNWMSGFPIAPGFFEPDPRLEIERLELEEYQKRSRRGPVGPAPVLYAPLLWGPRR